MTLKVEAPERTSTLGQSLSANCGSGGGAGDWLALEDAPPNKLFIRARKPDGGAAGAGGGDASAVGGGAGGGGGVGDDVPKTPSKDEQLPSPSARPTASALPKPARRSTRKQAFIPSPL